MLCIRSHRVSGAARSVCLALDLQFRILYLAAAIKKIMERFFIIIIYLTDLDTSIDKLSLYLFSRLNEQSLKAHSGFFSPPPLYFLKHPGFQH